MKKGFIFALILALLASAGCGDDDAVVVDPNAGKEAAPQQLESAPEQAEAEAPAAERYVFTAEGMEILPNAEAEPVLAALGEAAFTFEADSCAYQGKDYFYKYNGFQLTVNEMDGTRRIVEIAVVDDTISVPFLNGSLRIGDPAEKLFTVLGGEAGQEQYDYHSDVVHLQLSLKDGRISTMVFMAPEEY